jgi:adenylylsulfate kinase
MPRRNEAMTIRHRAKVLRRHREALNGHKSIIIWFTGYSGSGKSTIAHTVEERLHQMGCNTFVLDGDNVRSGLCADLGFSRQDRAENIRRISELAKLFLEGGLIVLIALISPFRADRQRARALVGENDFMEIYCRCPIELCEQRDVKGFYRRAKQGEIPEYTGVSSPYEPPDHPELILDTDACSLEVCVEQVLAMLFQRGVIKTHPTAKSM